MGPVPPDVARMRAVLVSKAADVETSVDSSFIPAGIVRDGFQYLLSDYDDRAPGAATACYVDVVLEEHEVNRLIQRAKRTRNRRTSELGTASLTAGPPSGAPR